MYVLDSFWRSQVCRGVAPLFYPYNAYIRMYVFKEGDVTEPILI